MPAGLEEEPGAGVHFAWIWERLSQLMGLLAKRSENKRCQGIVKTVKQHRALGGDSCP
jgi:hypothetical protein